MTSEVGPELSEKVDRTGLTDSTGANPLKTNDLLGILGGLDSRAILRVAHPGQNIMFPLHDDTLIRKDVNRESTGRSNQSGHSTIRFL